MGSAFAVSLRISFGFAGLYRPEYVLFKRPRKRTATIVYLSTHACVSFHLSLDSPLCTVGCIDGASMHSRKHLPFMRSALLVERREILRAFRRFSRDPPCRIPTEGSTARPTNRSVLTREIGVERGSCQRPSATFADSRGSSERFSNGRGLYHEVTTLVRFSRTKVWSVLLKI